MIEWADPQSDIEKVQYFSAARTDADPFFENVGIYLMRPRANESATQIIGKIEAALNTLVATNGKAGLAIIVMMPKVTNMSPDSPVALLRNRLMFQVIENPLINLGATGTKISAEMACRRLITLMNGFLPPDVASSLAAESDCMVPMDDPQGRVAYGVTFSCLTADTSANKTPTPGLALDGDGNLVASCAFGTAQIYYTTDGSHPYAKNTAALLYPGTPVAVAAGTRIFAVAYFNGLPASDVASLQT